MIVVFQPVFAAHFGDFPDFPVPIVSFPQADVSLQQAVISTMAMRCGRSDAIQPSASNAVPVNNDWGLTMKKFVSGILLLLTTLPALAEEAIQAMPKVETSPIALIICAVLFVGMIGGFFAYIAWKDRRDQEKSVD